ncbi:tai fiber protein [Escherichia coli]|uniref:gp53-like domain-containing protein n=2 Tax=Escherichia coli TaxID=562 RepID=UPI001919D27C|nr:tai fiber protein [Escherichia coli]
MQNLMPPINTPDQLFHDGDPTQGIEGTLVTAGYLNNQQGATRDLQQELLNVLGGAHIQPDPQKTDQLLTALRALLLSRKNPFGDIKLDGTVQKALENLGLGEAAKRDVGTGDNQIPDMGAFASGSGWFRLPGGYIVQFGTFSGNTTRFISGHFPIPFPNQPMVSVSVMSDAVQSDPSNPAPQVLSVNFEHISNSAWRVATSDISQQYRFSYISIGR